MKRRLLDLIVCPKCHGVFSLDPFDELSRGRPQAAESDAEVIEGSLRCEDCGATFPVIAGIPRLLGPRLLAPVSRHHPDFFARHPEFLPQPGDSPKADPLVDTLESFTRQRLELRPPGPEFVDQWRSHLRRNLGPMMGVADLRDQLILDVGCGFGRHLHVASEAGAEIVGVDLSGGVDVAWRNNRNHPRCHVVQADIFDQPFRQDLFDIVWSFGVLHHMPNPQAGFEAIVPFTRQDGGRVIIWVYGYRGMAFTYRLSHMRTLHRLTRKMSGRGRVRMSKVIAALLSAGYWEPLRVTQWLGLRRIVKRLPLTDHISQGWLSRVSAVHDRLSTPITHFHDREELEKWFELNGLSDVVVEDTDRRGWRAYGTRHVSRQTAPEVEHAAVAGPDGDEP
jgi:SAM-dependent methyltransferase